MRAIVLALLLPAALLAVGCGNGPGMDQATPAASPQPTPASPPPPAVVGLDGAPSYTAGEPGPDLLIRVTAGADGLAAGTLLRLTLPGERWSAPQLEAGEAPGYIRVEAPGEPPLVVVAAQGVGRVPSRTRATLDIELASALAASASLSVCYSAPLAQTTAGSVPLRVQLRLPGDLKLTELQTLSVPVLAGPPVWVSILAPSDVIVGLPFRVRLRPLDRFGNLAQAPAGTHTLELVRPGFTTGREIATAAGDQDWVVDQAGQGLFTLFNADGRVAGRGQPVQVHANPPRLTRAWADLSFHTGLSDAFVPVSPEQALLYGRDVSGLDLACLSDNAEGIGGDPLSSDEFAQSVAAAERASAPNFLALAGFTWTGKYFLDPDYPEGPGNIHVVPLAEPIAPCRADTEECDDPEELFARLGSGRGLAIWQHPLAAWGAADLSQVPLPEAVAPLVQIYSSHGCYEFPGCRPGLEQGSDEPRHGVQAALVRGIKIGFSASSDDRTGHPGLGRFPGYAGPERELGGLTCLLVNERGRVGFERALRGRRTYATTGIRPLIEFTAGAAGIGDTLTTGEPPRFEVAVTSAEPLAAVEIVKGGAGYPLPLEVVQRSEPRATSAAFSWVDQDFSGAAFYYLRIVDINGERAWTSPIWVETAGPAGGAPQGH